MGFGVHRFATVSCGLFDSSPSPAPKIPSSTVRRSVVRVGSTESGREGSAKDEGARGVGETELRIGSSEADIAYVCGRLPSRGYRVNRITGEVVVAVPEEDLVDMLDAKHRMAA